MYGATTSAAQASQSARAGFIRLTYMHLAGALVAFAILCAGLINSPIAPKMMEILAASPMMWLAFLGGFMAVSWVAERWAANAASPKKQYLGLGLYVVFEALLFTPLLFIAANYFPGVIARAGIMTGALFAGLTASVFLTGKDFSFMRQALTIGGFVAMGLIVAGMVFGFDLGLWFSVAMVIFAAGSILYNTSNVMHHYPVGSHVAASLSLFASVALLFWYILRILMSLRD